MTTNAQLVLIAVVLWHLRSMAQAEEECTCAHRHSDGVSSDADAGSPAPTTAPVSAAGSSSAYMIDVELGKPIEGYYGLQVTGIVGG